MSAFVLGSILGKYEPLLWLHCIAVGAVSQQSWAPPVCDDGQHTTHTQQQHWPILAIYNHINHVCDWGSMYIDCNCTYVHLLAL